MKIDSVVRTISWVLMTGREMLNGSTTLTPSLDAEVMQGKVLTMSRTQLFIHGNRVVSDEEYRDYRSLLDKRAAGMPVAYITGRREFMSLLFCVDQRCLIPRPETEMLVEVALVRIRKRMLKKPAILELGTGSGCISVALAHGLPEASITATDISKGALEVARFNAAFHGFEKKIGFLESDLYEALGEEQYDMIISNPPYIAEDEIFQLPGGVRDYEPSLALWTGEEGIAITRRIIEGASMHLEEKGILALEMNPRKTGRVRELIERSGFSAVDIVHDLAGYERVMVAERKVDYNGK